jgi:succinate dehydrogenase/fumarate reductase flavoprotein subunit
MAAQSAAGFDVVVVGGGAAGLAAAIEARELGRSVLLLEKNPAPGGSTAWAVGSISASATPHQIRRGIKDRPEDHLADMPLFAGDLDARDNPDLRRILCDALPGTFRWLLDAGLRFHGPMPEPPHGRPRMHNVLPNARAYVARLGRRARRAGVVLRTGQRVERLVTGHGRVVGVEVGGNVIRARAVVLATGDFTAGQPLKLRFMGEREARVEAVNPTATGDGQTMALELGARVVNGDLALGPELRFVPPPGRGLLLRLPPWPWLGSLMAWSLDRLPPRILRPLVMAFVTTALAPSLSLLEQGGVLVDREGAPVEGPPSELAFALAERPGKAGYILLDDELSRRFERWPHFVSTAPGVAYAYLADYRRNRPDVCHAARDLGELASHLGMREGALDGVLAKPGPLVALGPVRPVFVHAEGGLAVDTCHRVLGPNDLPIPGLWAAGATGQGGLLLKGHGHHLAWAFVSGRRAGRLAAFETTTPDSR